MTKFVGAAEKLHGMTRTEWRKAKFHGAMVLVAQGEDVNPHGESLASGAGAGQPMTALVLDFRLDTKRESR